MKGRSRVVNPEMSAGHMDTTGFWQDSFGRAINVAAFLASFLATAELTVSAILRLSSKTIV
jgi:hypothetical protein